MRAFGFRVGMCESMCRRMRSGPLRADSGKPVDAPGVMLRAVSEPRLRTSPRPGQPQPQLPRGPGRGPEGGF